jgi:hypothetical protein
MSSTGPDIAQQIVAEYARRLERDSEVNLWPADADALPYPKQTIKSAIRTSVQTLESTGQLTDELHEFLETAYVALADYVAADLARLMNEFQRAGTDLAADKRLTSEKTMGPAWRTMVESGRLAGEIARAIASEADALRAEFRTFASI